MEDTAGWNGISTEISIGRIAEAGKRRVVRAVAAEIAQWAGKVAAGHPMIVCEKAGSAPLQDPKTVEQQVSEGFRQERLLATLSTFFALLAAIGLFGVLSFSVNQRFREMGIRMALGASPGQVFGIVIRDVLLFGGLGFALAIPAIYCMTRAVAALLFGVDPLEPLTIGIATGVMAVTALAAGSLPARSASRIEPAIILRSE